MRTCSLLAWLLQCHSGIGCCPQRLHSLCAVGQHCPCLIETLLVAGPLLLSRGWEGRQCWGIVLYFGGFCKGESQRNRALSTVGLAQEVSNTPREKLPIRSFFSLALIIDICLTIPTIIHLFLSTTSKLVHNKYLPAHRNGGLKKKYPNDLNFTPLAIVRVFSGH